ncbi:MAG: branched-chain amino acid ABC transporter permease [Thermoleophilia bacterium]
MTVLALIGAQDVQKLVDAVALGSIYALMAVGIGLVFGVMRLVNFAYGQLVMAGAYALYLSSRHGASTLEAILVCFAVVIGLALLMEVVAFRRLRQATPATMLVATFAISYLLQSIAVLWFGTLGNIDPVLQDLRRPFSLGNVYVAKITVVTVVVAALALATLALLLNRTTIGLQLRAAAADFVTARLLGVRGNAVVAAAVVVSGALAATVSVLLPVAQSPLITPDYALRDTIFVLVAVVVGGIDRLLSATLGGFAVGFAVGLMGGFLPTRGEWPFTSSIYIDSALYTAVILVLLFRPTGIFARRGQRAVERV